MLNIQLLDVRSSSHSSSSLECAKGKAYNVKIQFVETIIQDIDIIETFKVEFLHRSRQHQCGRKQTGPRVTSIDLVCLKELEENEVEKHHFVEAQMMQKDTREENVITQEEQLFTKMQLIVHQAIEVQTATEA